MPETLSTVDTAKNQNLTHRISSWFDGFFFAPVNPRAAAMFRIALSAMLCWSFFAGNARLTSKMSGKPWQVDLYNQVFLTAPYCWLLAALMLGFALGYRPRVLGSLLVVLLLPYCFLFQGQQSRQIILFALLCFSFVRSDACWKLALRPKPRFVSGEFHEYMDGEYMAGPMWPIRLIQLQLTVVYGVNALFKSKPEFLSGQALIDMSRTLSNFRVDLSDGFLHLDLAALGLSSLGSWMIPVAALAMATVASEYALAFGFWVPRLRIALAVFGVTFHLILKLIVKIFMLDWASMFLYLAFLLPFEKKTKRVEVTSADAR